MEFNYKEFSENNVSLDKDVFEYGTKILNRYLKFLSLTLVFSIILCSVFELILFLMFFMPIRRYIGGLHLNDSKMCLIASFSISLLVSCIAQNINVSDIVFSILFICLTLLIYYFAPVDHPNKKISNIETKIYKFTALKISFIYLLVYFLFAYLRFKSICNVIFLVVSLCIFLLAIPILKKKYILWRCL